MVNVYAATTQPNILLIVADDMGYSDIAPFGGEIETPNLDQLANDGVKIRDFYVTPICSTTRAELLSGVDHHLAGFATLSERFKPNQIGQPGYEGHLNDRVVSVAERLQDVGYHTYMVGKWHLGHELEYAPISTGFEKTFALMAGGASHYSDGRPILPHGIGSAFYRENGQFVELPEDFYSTTYYTDKMMEFISDQTDDNPFFAYYAVTAPHDPLHAPEEWIKKYAGKYNSGYEAVKKQRFERMKQMGLIDDKIPFDPPFMPVNEDEEGMVELFDWDNFSAEEKAIAARKMEVYAAMIGYLDSQVGRLVSFLKQQGKFDNTVIFFFADNGANPSDEDYHAYPHVTKEWVQANFDNSLDNIGLPNSYVAQGVAWAEVSMTPFSYFKTVTGEGGYRTPLIISGAGVKQQVGFKDANAILTDITRTIVDLAGIEAEDSGGVVVDKAAATVDYKDRKVYPLGGVSMKDFLAGNATEVRDYNQVKAWEISEHKSLRRGDWKITNVAKTFGSGEWELYNVAEDPREVRSLNKAEEQPELLAELIALWEDYRDKVGIIDGIAFHAKDELDQLPEKNTDVGGDDTCRARSYREVSSEDLGTFSQLTGLNITQNRRGGGIQARAGDARYVLGVYGRETSEGNDAAGANIFTQEVDFTSEKLTTKTRPIVQAPCALSKGLRNFGLGSFAEQADGFMTVEGFNDEFFAMRPDWMATQIDASQMNPGILWTQASPYPVPVPSVMVDFEDDEGVWRQKMLPALADRKKMESALGDVVIDEIDGIIRFPFKNKIYRGLPAYKVTPCMETHGHFNVIEGASFCEAHLSTSRLG